MPPPLEAVPAPTLTPLSHPPPTPSPQSRTDQTNKAGEIKRLHEDLEKGKRDLIEKEMRFAREVERMGRVVKAQAGRLQQVGGQQQQQHNPQPGGPGREEEEREEEEEEEGSMAS